MFKSQHKKLNNNILRSLKGGGLIVLFLVNTVIYAQNVGINSTGALPDASAILDVSASDKGLLIPRVNIAVLSTAAPVTAPVTSLLVYNTNITTGVGYYYWDGSAWVALASSSTSDDDWYEVGTTTAPDDINDDIFTQGAVAIGTAIPIADLTVGGGTPTNDWIYDGAADRAIVLAPTGSTTAGLLLSSDVENQIGFDLKLANSNERMFGLQHTGIFGDSYLKFKSMNDNESDASDDILVMRHNGNVGIGANDPQAQLHIQKGTFNFTNDWLWDSSSELAQIISVNNLHASLGIIAQTQSTIGFDVTAGPSNQKLMAMEMGTDAFSRSWIKFHSKNDDGTNAQQNIMVLEHGGNIGIGTGAPSESLHINGGFRLVDGTQGVGLVLTSDANGVGTWQPSGGGGSDDDWYEVGTTTAPTSINDDIFTQGDVGIGTSSPSTNVEISESASTTIPMLELDQLHASGDCSMKFSQVTNDWTVGIDDSDAGKFKIYDGTTLGTTDLFEDMVITTDADVGFGIGSPKAKLQALNPDAGEVSTILASNSTYSLNNSVSGYGFSLSSSSASKASIFFKSGSAGFGRGHLIFALNKTGNWTTSVAETDELMRLDYNGNLGVGTSSPTHKIHVEGSFSGACAKIKNTAGTNSDGLTIELNIAGGTSNANDYVNFLNQSSNQGAIEGTGTGVNYATTSDRRLKQNIKDISGALSIVNSMNPKYYEYISNPEVKEFGFIAQELQLVYPQAVSGDPNSDVTTHPMMVDYSRLTPVLTAAVKELHENLKEQQESNDDKTRFIIKLEKSLESQSKLIEELSKRLEKLERK